MPIGMTALMDFEICAVGFAVELVVRTVDLLAPRELTPHFAERFVQCVSRHLFPRLEQGILVNS